MIGLLVDLFGLFGKRTSKSLGNAVIRIKHKGFVDSLRTHLKTQNPALADADLARTLPVTRPLVGDLVAAYALDGAPATRYADATFLAANRLGVDELHDAAFANTRKDITRQIAQHQMDHFIGVESTVPGAAAALVLFPEYWQSWERKLGAPLLATIPGRDFVAFRAMPASGPERDRALLHALVMKRSAIAAFEESGNHALSEFSFDVRGGKLTVAAQLGDDDAHTLALASSPLGDEVLGRHSAAR